MKNWKHFTLLAFLVIFSIVVVFIACDNQTTSNNNDDKKTKFEGTWTHEEMPPLPPF